MKGKSPTLRGNKKGAVIKRQTTQITNHHESLQMTKSHITRVAMSDCK